MKIYLTGDVHGSDAIERLEKFSLQHKELNKEDYVIVLGDFLGTSDNYNDIISRINKLNYTTLFIDGDCENYDYLKSLPSSDFKCGKAESLSENLIHLKRGEVYIFDDIKIFTFGGGDFLTEVYGLENNNIRFQERIPTLKELKYGLNQLEKYNNNVDFVLSHESPSSAFIYKDNIKLTHTTKLLDIIDNKIKYKWWYFGHYHHDMKANNHKTIVYEKFIRIK